MMKHCILLSLCTFCAVPVFGQNINPTVEVTNAYEGNLMEIHKPQQVMALPDSLMHFNLDFSYSVFESPYRGSYEFRPYVMNMKPQPDAYDGKTLYLRAGAGFTFHPELTFAYSPRFKGKHQMSVYDDFRSYFGPYRSIDKDMKGSTGTFDGRDYSNRFGVDGRVDWEKSVFSYDVGFTSISAKDTIMDRHYRAVDMSARVRSNNDGDKYFYYDGGLSLSFGEDRFSTMFPSSFLNKGISENIFAFDGSFGPVLSRNSRFLVDVDMTVATYGNLLDANVGMLDVTPKYQIAKGRWDFSLGVKFGGFAKNDKTESAAHYKMFQNGSQILYPDLHADFNVIRSYLTLYGNVTGGDKANTYRSVLQGYHFFNPFASDSFNAMLDNTVENVNFAAGAKGNIATRLHYDLKAGYSVVEKGMFDKVVCNPLINGFGSYSPEIMFANYRKFYSQFLFFWKSRTLVLDGGLAYQATKFRHPENNLFKPASLSGDFRARYCWKDRISAGLDLNFASSRKGYLESVLGEPSPVKIPAYADLGMSVEYQFSRKMSFWATGGNLLNQNIQRHPYEPNSGIYFTAGICVNL